MKWPWNRDLPSPPCGGAEARRKAAESLTAAEAQWPEVKRVSGSLRALRERNHFADQIQLIFEGSDRER